jgi:hypothetical protein
MRPTAPRAAADAERWAARSSAWQIANYLNLGTRIATGKVVHGKVELDGDSFEEGSTVTALVPQADDNFELTPDEEIALEESLKQAAQGQLVDAEALLRELRQ